MVGNGESTLSSERANAGNPGRPLPSRTLYGAKMRSFRPSETQLFARPSAVRQSGHRCQGTKFPSRRNGSLRVQKRAVGASMLFTISMARTVVRRRLCAPRHSFSFKSAAAATARWGVDGDANRLRARAQWTCNNSSPGCADRFRANPYTLYIYIYVNLRQFTSLFLRPS